MSLKYEQVRLLIEHGADISARAHDGETPLHGAARQGHAIDAGTSTLLAGDTAKG